MAAITQLGTAVDIGFNSYTFTGYLMESMGNESTGEQKVIKDEDNATYCILVEDKGRRLNFTAVVKSGSTPESIEQGDVITVNSVNYRVESASVARTPEEARLSITCIKEDSVTY